MLKNYRKLSIKFTSHKNISYSEDITKCIMISKKYLNHNTFIAEYLPKDQKYIQISPGMHEGKNVSKRYTPVPNFNNNLQLLIKVYRPNENFPEGGRVSQYLDNIQIGESIDIKYPYGKIFYAGNGRFFFKITTDNLVVKNFSEWNERSFKKIAMIAGGTGITPIYTILYESFKRNETNLNFYLINANKTEDDMFYYHELENLRNKINLETLYVCEEIEKHSLRSSHLKEGLITIDHIKKVFPPQTDDLLILSCGSKIMNNYFIKPMLLQMKYNENNIFLL